MEIPETIGETIGETNAEPENEGTLRSPGVQIVMGRSSTLPHAPLSDDEFGRVLDRVGQQVQTGQVSDTANAGPDEDSGQ